MSFARKESYHKYTFDGGLRWRTGIVLLVPLFIKIYCAYPRDSITLTRKLHMQNIRLCALPNYVFLFLFKSDNEQLSKIVIFRIRLLIINRKPFLQHSLQRVLCEGIVSCTHKHKVRANENNIIYL